MIKAGSAREAFEHLLKKDIAIVLSDVCMPELDGFELARMIRNHPRFQQTAIIFVSAVALTDPDRIKGTGSGHQGAQAVSLSYHSQFREVRESTKYEHIVAFANALPAIRAKVREHIARRGLPREKVLATLVHLLNILGHKGDGRSDSARTKVRQFKADPKGKPSPIPSRIVRDAKHASSPRRSRSCPTMTSRASCASSALTSNARSRAGRFPSLPWTSRSTEGFRPS